MASSHDVQFATIHNSQIYFHAGIPGCETDTFSRCKECFKLLRNCKNQFLVATRDEVDMQLVFKNLSVEEQKNDKSKVRIRMYSNTDPTTALGTPVTIQLIKDGQVWTVWCSEKDGQKSVEARSEDVPEYIPSSHHGAMFFLKMVDVGSFGHQYTLETSMWRNWLLSFEDQKSSLLRLVLKEKGYVNELTIVTL